MNPGKEFKDSAALLQQYATKEYEYAQLKFFYQASSVSTSIAKFALIGICAVIAMGFLSLAAALGIGAMLGNWVLGFLIMGGIFLLITLIVYSMRKRIEHIIVKKMSATYFES